MTLSPDGKWLWNGENWIPAPPKASPSAIEEAKEAIQKIAEKHGLDVQELSKVVENFDLDEDGSIDKEEIEKAVLATQSKPTQSVPTVSPQEINRIGQVTKTEIKNDYRNYSSPQIPSPNWASSSEKDELYSSDWEGTEVDADVSISGLPSKRIPVIVASCVTVLILILVSISPILTNLENVSLSDFDGDGIPNSEETDSDASIFDPDTDNDGVFDGLDSCTNGEKDWISNEDSDIDSDGCRDDSEDKDDDNDGILDDEDSCPSGMIAWASNITSDLDQDGCRDSDEDADDDGDTWLDSYDAFPYLESQWADSDGDGYGDNPLGYNADVFPNDSTQWADSDGDGYGDNPNGNNSDAFPNESTQWADSDGDGYGDNLNGVDADKFPEDGTQWADTDGDGYGDNLNGNNADIFPNDPLEWSDNDSDGWGDNSDPDDDNDGVLDVDDLNPNRDAALLLNLDEFRVFTEMDFFDSYTELYICVWVNSVSQGCLPENYEWSLQIGSYYPLNVTYNIDLDETETEHYILIGAWDSDSLDDDPIDIDPNPDYNQLLITINSLTLLSEISGVGDGTSDSTGWDGILRYSLIPYDQRLESVKSFEWEFREQNYELDWSLNYDNYVDFRSLSHDINWNGAEDFGDVIGQYAAFADTESDYVSNLANRLVTIALESGYSSDEDVADFIYSFVGSIQYQFDEVSSGEEEYPKYPIEMLWEQNGDCEDAALLFISLTESIGLDSILLLGEVKQDENDEDWGGHAWAAINLEFGSGTYYWGPGDKNSQKFWFVETTDYTDGISKPGDNPWYDNRNTYMFDVE